MTGKVLLDSNLASAGSVRRLWNRLTFTRGGRTTADSIASLATKTKVTLNVTQNGLEYLSHGELHRIDSSDIYSQHLMRAGVHEVSFKPETTPIEVRRVFDALIDRNLKAARTIVTSMNYGFEDDSTRMPFDWRVFVGLAKTPTNPQTIQESKEKYIKLRNFMTSHVLTEQDTVDSFQVLNTLGEYSIQRYLGKLSDSKRQVLANMLLHTQAKLPIITVFLTHYSIPQDQKATMIGFQQAINRHAIFDLLNHPKLDAETLAELMNKFPRAKLLASLINNRALVKREDPSVKPFAKQKVEQRFEIVDALKLINPKLAEEIKPLISTDPNFGKKVKRKPSGTMKAAATETPPTPA